MGETNQENTADVFSQIRTAYQGMSTAETKIADFLLENARTLDYFSITDLAAQVGTSESTIVRFARRLGYSGFPAFKKALFSGVFAETSQTQPLSYERLVAGDTLGEVRKKLFGLMRTTLDDTINNISPEGFDSATHRLAAARRVKVFANNQSGHIAQTATHKFLLLGMDISVHTERVLHKLQAERLGSKDLCIVLSHSGEADDLLEAMEAARARGAAAIAITSNASSRIARSADIHFLTALPISGIGDEAGLVRLNQIAVLDCLALAVAHYRSQLMNDRA